MNGEHWKPNLTMKCLLSLAGLICARKSQIKYDEQTLNYTIILKQTFS